jgi:hypothetical protein
MLPTMRSDVEFPGFGGVTLRGWLYRPETEAPAAGIVMAHGFSATRHMGLAAYAEAFQAAGYATLVYDHRGLGDSEGEPRQEINPWAQARDYRYALTWLSQQPGIDRDRLGIWGSSFSGGEVLVVGAVDPRVKVVLANVPFGGFSADVDRPGLAAQFEAMRAALEDESGAGPADSAEPVIGPLPVVRTTGSAEDAPAFLAQPESTEWFEALGGQPGSGWRNAFTLRGLSGTMPFDPAIAAPFIAPRPLLMVVADADRVAPVEHARAAYHLAGEPKQIELIAGHHYAPYSGAARERAIKVMRDFLATYL